MKRLLLCFFVVALLGGQAAAKDAVLWSWDDANMDGKVAQSELSGDTTNINGAIFNTIYRQPTGTGVFMPFVRIQDAAPPEAAEEGYNSDAATNDLPYDEKSGKWTHSIMLSDIPIRDGSYLFVLDIDETAAEPLITLQELQIYVGTDPRVATGDVDSLPGGVMPLVGDPLLGTLAYDLDVGPHGDSSVELHYLLNEGSGSGDLEVLIPVAAFDGLSGYLTLYSKFYGSDDGFEEWGVVPLPGAALLGFLGLGFAGMKLRKMSV